MIRFLQSPNLHCLGTIVNPSNMQLLVHINKIIKSKVKTETSISKDMFSSFSGVRANGPFALIIVLLKTLHSVVSLSRLNRKYCTLCETS